MFAFYGEINIVDEILFEFRCIFKPGSHLRDKQKRKHKDEFATFSQ